MKKRILSLICSVAMLFSISLPAYAAPSPVLTLDNPFGESITCSDRTFYYDFKANGTIDDNSLNISYTANVPAISLTTASNTLNGLDAGTTYRLNFSVANTIVAGSYSLKLQLDFKVSGVEKTQEVFIPVFVSDSNDVLIKNISLPSSVAGGEQATIGFDVINEGSSIGNVTVSIKDSSSKSLASKYLSSISSGETTPYEFKINAPAKSETLYATVDYTFNGSSYTKSESFKLNYGASGSSANIEIRNIICPSKAIVKEANTLSFDIINSSSASYVSCEASITDGTYSYGYAFVGDIAANAATPVKLEFTCNNKKTYKFTANLTFKDAAGNIYKKSFNFSVTASAQALGSETGNAKIQFISSPMYSQIGASIEFKFDLTNPTSTEIKGAEAFLYDENGNLSDSVYISSLPANSSSEISMSYVPSTTGAHTYKISIQYLDSNNNKKSITGSFNTVVKTDASTASEGKPANIKIAKISNPSRLYTNVTTAIPFTIVNGGKGEAYNVEVIITDPEGNELARDYIGTIAASAKFEGETKIKFSETGNKDLTLTIYYENYDETNTTVSKMFSQMIADYRVTVDDLSGYDWLIEGEQVTLSFSIQNLGTLELLNTTADLIDQNGNIVGSCFVGVVSANSKLENQKFKKLFLTPDVNELSIQLSYEDANGEIFNAVSEASTPIHVMSYEEAYGGGEMIKPEFGVDEDGNQILGFDEAGNPIIGYNEDGTPIISGQSSEGGFPVWGWILIGVGVVAVVVVVVIIIKKKKKKSDDSNDMDYFYSQSKEEINEDTTQNQ